MVDFKEVVVAVDGSANALRAARFGARLAHAVGRPLKLMFVFRLVGDEIVGLASLSKEQIEQTMRSVARQNFDQAMAEIGAQSTPPTEVMMHGDPAEEIINFIEANPESLVVMGRRGKGTLAALTLGSVSDKVIRHANGAVTLVG